MPKKSSASGPESEGVVVTAQQSRFHTDAVDAPASKEILVKTLTVSVGQLELLSNAELFLKEGGHYVLVGRNGTGKSTLLRAIADKRVPGIPWSLNVLLLGQTRELTLDEEVDGLSVQDETVLEHVMRSNKARDRYLREASILSAALDQQNDPAAPVRAYRQLSHERLEQKLRESQLIATRRSGARGAKARKVLIAVEEEFAASQERLTRNLSEIEPMELSSDTQAAAEMLGDIHSALEMMNASEAEADARVVLRGLGFTDEQIDAPMSKLSGGWRTRCDLACALCQQADVLFLDEPSNFLDLPAIIWLQNYICALEKTTVVVVTHDRDFADAVADELLLLRHQKLEHFRGNLSLYESERLKKVKWMTTMKEAQEKQTKHMEQTIKNSIDAAKRTGDDKKLKQAASRRKKLEERTGLEVNAKGGRFKLNRDRAGWHLSNRAEIEIPDFDPIVRIKIPCTPPDLRFPGALVSLEGVCFSYPGRKSPEILKDVNLTIHPGERVGICGLNGSGKTTLISLIIGSGEEGGYTPKKGTITRHSRARFARFSQPSVEELEAFGVANKTATALGHLLDISEGQLDEKEARQILGSLGLQGRVVSDVPISALSGGQKVRLALAKVVWSPPHLLVLDEVTTHLDSDTILGLILALREYEGALLVVTHDRFFMRCIVEGESPAKRIRGVEEEEEDCDEEEDEEGPARKGVVYRLFKSQLKRLEGGMDEYTRRCEARAKRAARV
ncbi:ABC transporter ATP-binding protein uup-1 [Trichodelitschia bisporula]|uniref:ABC transporter ATP-binding protein uup-1 n=1 Tax=Trichodelitschia bisporula TaxID=703511 RepID=A0A6G1HSS9_9PEZI|nr:ABC transporter ATP-binding protein uup-1 [Trichodelitschia bisporula]